jgi:hypothetical protein
MIDTVIQCSKCEELISVIARSISFPFVCDGCLGDTQMHELEKQEPYFDHAADAAEADEEFDDFDHDGASIEAMNRATENTTLLIEDLESQIRTAHEELDESQAWENLSHETIGKLLGKQAELRRSLELSESLISNLRSQRDHLVELVEIQYAEFAARLADEKRELAKAKRSPWRKFIDYVSANPYEKVLDSPDSGEGVGPSLN